MLHRNMCDRHHLRTNPIRVPCSYPVCQDHVQMLQKSYLSVNAKLKKESVKLHQKFIESCYERLEQVFSPKDQKRDDAQEGCEIEV